MGKSLVLEQCSSCGGIWFDRWELYQTGDADLDRLDPVDSASLRAPAAITDAPLLCPKCSHALSRFSDPLLPPDAHILRCPACEGLWLNRGELRKYEGFRKMKRSAQPKALPPEALAILQQHMGDKEAWQRVAGLGALASSDADIGKGAIWSNPRAGDIFSTAVNLLLSFLL